MRAESAGRIIKLGLTNFWRNRWLSFAATLIMTLTLLIISFFTISNLAVGRVTDSVRSRIDISVYFNDLAATSQIAELQRNLVSRSDVKTVTYVSKDDAAASCTKNPFCNRAYSLVSGQMTLPPSLAIKAVKPEDLQAINDYLGQDNLKPIIHSISYQDNKSFIDRLIAITSFTKEFGWLLCGVFVIISILVIINTIRLTIFTRRDEIEIMRLVGANDSFIKIPFVIEGLIYGILATFLSMSLVWISLAFIVPRTEQLLGASSGHTLLMFFQSNFWLMLGLELLIGVAIGMSCSLISIRKYLKV